jgi:hypothetical protein
MASFTTRGDLGAAAFAGTVSVNDFFFSFSFTAAAAGFVSFGFDCGDFFAEETGVRVPFGVFVVGGVVVADFTGLGTVFGVGEGGGGVSLAFVEVEEDVDLIASSFFFFTKAIMLICFTAESFFFSLVVSLLLAFGGSFLAGTYKNTFEICHGGYDINYRACTGSAFYFYDLVLVESACKSFP